MNFVDSGFDDLRNHLQAAVTLELATIPVYLFSAWSIKDQTDLCATTIGDIATLRCGT